jgi:glycosyltransferase involved in cell wall biosynthesis
VKTASSNGQPGILVIAPFPPSKAPEADHAYYLCENLAQAGWHVDVLTTKGSVPAAHPDITVHSVMKDWSWRELPRWAWTVRNCRPDVGLLVYMGWVYGHHPMVTFAPTIAKRVMPGLCFVTLFEGVYGALAYDELTRTVRAGRRIAAQWAGSGVGSGVDYNFGTLLRDSDRVLTLCAEHESALTTYFPTLPTKTARMPIGPILRVCPEENGQARQYGRALLGIGSDELLITYFGYMYPGKGVETLLKAFQLVAAQQNNLQLALVGGILDGSFQNGQNTHNTQNGQDDSRSYADELRRLASQLGIEDRVKWVGGFSHNSEEPSLCLRATDICVLPFDGGVRLNNSSFAAAAAHGLPIITTGPGIMEAAPFVDEQNVLLCFPKDPTSLAEAICRLIIQPELRARLSHGATQLAADQFSWAKAINLLSYCINGWLMGTALASYLIFHIKYCI